MAFRNYDKEPFFGGYSGTKIYRAVVSLMPFLL